MNIKQKLLTYISNKWNSSTHRIDLEKIKFLNIGNDIKAIKQEQIDNQYKNCITELVNNCEDTYKSLLQVLLNNQLHRIQTDNINLIVNTGASVIGTNLFLFRITADVVKRISQLSCIVGIQPMTNPVGLLYKIQITDKPPIDQNISSKCIEIVSTAVEARSRKLQAIINIESIQDVKALHNIDIELEVQKILVDEIAADIIADILHNIVKISTPNIKTIIHREDDDIQLHAKHILTAINRASLQIATSSQRGKGNIIICSPDSVTLLKQYLKLTAIHTVAFRPSHKPNIMSELAYAGDIITETGSTIYSVYSSTLSIFDIVGKSRFLIGYKSRVSEHDAGYYFCPYMPVITTGIVIDQMTFAPKLGLMTRYGLHPTIEANDYDNASNYYRIVDADLINMLQIIA